MKKDHSRTRPASDGRPAPPLWTTSKSTDIDLPRPHRQAGPAQVTGGGSSFHGITRPSPVSRAAARFMQLSSPDSHMDDAGVRVYRRRVPDAPTKKEDIACSNPIPWSWAALHTRSVRQVCRQASARASSATATPVLTTCTVAKTPRPGIDFFPTWILKKSSTPGHIGSWNRHEAVPPGRPSPPPHRPPAAPLFPKGMRHDVSVVATIMSVDTNNIPTSRR